MLYGTYLVFTYFIYSRVCLSAVISVVTDSETPGTVAHQAPLSIGFSRQESWSGLSCPPLGGRQSLTQGLNPHLLRLPALAGGFFTTSATWV